MNIALAQIGLASYRGIQLGGCPLTIVLLSLDDQHLWGRFAINDILSLGSTTTLHSALCDLYLHRRFMALFQKISPNVERLRKKMRATGAVISG